MSIFAELADHAQLTFEQARMLPLEAYRSPAVLEAEVAELFGMDWLCVGRTADIPNTGDYLTATLPTVHGGDRSIIALRGEDGAVAAFDNVCVHRGAQLLHGCGNEARITCPYHAWVYRLDGSLVGGPYMNRTKQPDGKPFTPSDHSLAALRTETWEGFVFVNQDPDAAPLGPRLSGLTEVTARYNMAGYVPVHEQVDIWPTNWKLLVENFMDAYHIFKVHQESFAADGDNTADTVMYPGTDAWAHHRVIHEAGPDLAHQTNDSLEGMWRKTIVLAAAFPGFVIQLQPDWLWFLRITPVGTDQVRIAWQVAVAPEIHAHLDDTDLYLSDLMKLINLVNSEDHPIIEAVRRNTSRPQFDRAPLSYLERNVHDFDHYVATRLTHPTGR